MIAAATLRNALFLARADFTHLFRRWETWLWAFVLPIVFFYFIGTVTASMAGDVNRTDTIAILLPEDAGFLGSELVNHLENLGFRPVLVKTRQELAAYRSSIIVPPGFTDSVIHSTPVKLELHRLGAGAQADYDRVRVSRAVSSLLMNLKIVNQSGAPVTEEAFQRIAAEPRTLTLDVAPAGRRKSVPTGFDQSVPGSMVFFVLMLLFTSSGISLILERDQGILRRLASSPMSKTAVVLGKLGARLLLGGVQIAFAMLSGALLFHIHWGPNLPAICVVVLVFATFAAACGLLLGNLARTRAQAVAVGSIGTNLLAALGGCWWPAEVMPRWLQTISFATPTGLTMDALHQLVNFGAPPSAIVPHVLILLAGTIVAGLLVARSFRFQ